MLSRAVALVLLLVVEVAAVAGLHALGGQPWFALPSGDVGSWLATSAPEDVVVALLRLVALGCGYWLALSTGAYTLALVSRLPAAVRGTRWATHPAVRRVAERAVAVTMATSLAGGSATPAFAGVGDAVTAGARPAATQPAAAEERASAERAGQARTPPEVEPGPGDVLVAEFTPETPAGGIPPPRLTPESLPRPDEPASGAPDGRDPATPDGRDDVATEHDRVRVVESGDHLWSVAAADVAAVSQQDVDALDPDEIVPRWQEIVDANREQLRSGDPDLIYPGERIELPPRGE